jgi:hypothetical protein
MPLPTVGPYPSYVPTELKETEASGDLNMTASGSMVGTRVYECPYYDLGPPLVTYLDYMKWLLGRSYQDTDGTVHVVPPDVFSNELNFLVCQEISVRHKGLVGYEDAPGEPDMPPPGTARPLAVGPNDPSNPFTDLPDPSPNIDAPPIDWPPDYLTSPIQFSRRAVFRTSVLTCKYSSLTHDEEIKLHVRGQKHKGIGYAWSKVIAADVDDSEAITGQDLLVIAPNGDFSFSKRHVLAPKFFSILKLLGKINVAEFLGFPQYTVLFAGCDGKRSHLANGTPVWDMHLKFLLDPQQHCRKFRPGPGGGFVQYQKVINPPLSPFTVGGDPGAGNPVVISSAGHDLSVGSVVMVSFDEGPGVVVQQAYTVTAVTDATFSIAAAFSPMWSGTGKWHHLDAFANLPADFTPLLAYR